MIKGEAGPRVAVNQKRKSPTELTRGELAEVLGGAAEAHRKSSEEQSSKVVAIP